MVMPKHSSARASLWVWCRNALLGLAICSLTTSLATRYTGLGPQVLSSTAVKYQSPDDQRQRLLDNAVQWTAPVASFTLFQPPRSSVFAPSVVLPPTNLNSESWLFSRPPPSC